MTAAPATSGPAGRSKSVGKITELEGLRGWLAWWVVADHCLGAARYDIADLPGPLGVLRNGALAVAVFILLSGFVVFLLLDTQRTGYRAFLIRRFFRLFPVYLPCLALGWLGMLATARLAGEPGGIGRVGPLFAGRWADTMAHWPAHVAAHLTMLHGALPNSVLPYSSGAFLDPAWSISLEWQFYLLAPVFFWALGRASWAFAALGVFALVAEAAARRLVGFDFPSFLPLRLPFFWLGGVSYYAVKHWPDLDPEVWRPGWLVAGACLAPALFLRGTDLFWPAQIWFLCVALLVTRSAPATPVVGWLRKGLTAPWIQALGRWSYVTYLVHLPLIQIARYAFLTAAPNLTRPQLLLLMGATAGPATLLASALVSKWIEQPGIDLGRRWARRAAGA